MDREIDAGTWNWVGLMHRDAEGDGFLPHIGCIGHVPHGSGYLGREGANLHRQEAGAYISPPR